MQKILVFTPTKTIFKRTLDDLVHLRYTGPVDFMQTRDNPYRTHGPMSESYRRNVLYNYQKGRALALSGGYDAMLAIESDMAIPPDALEKLLEVDADVAYGLYCWRHGKPRWNAYIEPLGGTQEGSTMQSIINWPDRAREAWGKVVPVWGVGLGCTLIHRHVLEALEFRGTWPASCDWYFALDAVEKGFRQASHLGVVCGHMTMEPTPQILWPDADNPRGYRLELL